MDFKTQGPRIWTRCHSRRCVRTFGFSPDFVGILDKIIQTTQRTEHCQQIPDYSVADLSIDFCVLDVPFFEPTDPAIILTSVRYL